MQTIETRPERSLVPPRWQRAFLYATASAAVALVLSRPAPAPAGTPASPARVVSHVKVVSQNVPDVSSLAAWQASMLKPGMTDAQKALAIWKTVVMFRHQSTPPNELLQSERNVHDPIKTFNVYGYGQCCCASSNVEALARFAGLPARGRSLYGHSVPEIFYD